MIVKVFLVNYQAYEKSKIRFLELSLGLIFPDQYLTVVCKAEVKAALVDNDLKQGLFYDKNKTTWGYFWTISRKRNSIKVSDRHLAFSYIWLI